MPRQFRRACQIDLSGEGGGRWILRVVDQRCSVTPGVAARLDLHIARAGETFLRVHRGELHPIKEVILGRIKLAWATLPAWPSDCPFHVT